MPPSLPQDARPPEPPTDPGRSDTQAGDVDTAVAEHIQEILGTFAPIVETLDRLGTSPEDPLYFTTLEHLRHAPNQRLLLQRNPDNTRIYLVAASGREGSDPLPGGTSCHGVNYSALTIEVVDDTSRGGDVVRIRRTRQPITQPLTAQTQAFQVQLGTIAGEHYTRNDGYEVVYRPRLIPVTLSAERDLHEFDRGHPLPDQDPFQHGHPPLERADYQRRVANLNRSVDLVIRAFSPSTEPSLTSSGTLGSFPSADFLDRTVAQALLNSLSEASQQKFPRETQTISQIRDSEIMSTERKGIINPTSQYLENLRRALLIVGRWLNGNNVPQFSPERDRTILEIDDHLSIVAPRSYPRFDQGAALRVTTDNGEVYILESDRNRFYLTRVVGDQFGSDTALPLPTEPDFIGQLRLITQVSHPIISALGYIGTSDSPAMIEHALRYHVRAAMRRKSATSGMVPVTRSGRWSRFRRGSPIVEEAIQSVPFPMLPLSDRGSPDPQLWLPGEEQP